MVDHDPILPEYLDNSCTAVIEEFTIMGDDRIASLPGLFEVFLEPLDTLEIDEVRRLVEEEKVRFREQCFCEGDLGPLTSGYPLQCPIEEVKYPDPTRDSFDLILIGISSGEFILFDQFSIPLIFASFFEFSFFYLDASFYSSYFAKGISEVISDGCRLIHEVDLIEVSETHGSDIFDRSLIFTDTSCEYLHECTLANTIFPYDRYSISGIDHG